MCNLLKKIKIISKIFLFLLILFVLQRIIFFIFNYSFFKANSLTEILYAFLWGIRFDLWTIFAFNGIVFLIILLPFKFSFRQFLIVYIIFVNSFILLFNLIDVAYFPFTLKRSTYDIFNLIKTGQDVLILLPQFVIDFWYIVLLWFAFILLLWKYIPKMWRQVQSEFIELNTKNIILYIFSFILFIGIMFTVLRGTRLRPVNLLSASLHANSTLVPLVLNTPFSIIKTIGKSNYKTYKYFKNEADIIFNPFCTVKPNFIRKNKINIIVLILESFSKEHIGFFNKAKTKSYTPFLDSLLSESLVIKYSYANGRKSIESLPSILAGIPSLMETPYILSSFSSNQIEALPAILKKHGYKTSFYHGGTNGTMGFDVFSRMSGIEQYYGRWEYPYPEDYDGNWGIWDEPYLQYVKKELDKTIQPFFSVVYTLSSHHPYNIPEKYKNVFSEGEHEILKSIAYADYSLKRFFDQASKSKWFDNTLFVLTADHVFGSHSDFYYNEIGSYSVPIAFYCKNDTSLKGVANIIAQHCDIAPTILDYAGIQTTIYTFGSSIWDSISKRFAINYINNTFMMFYNEYYIRFNGEELTGIYLFKQDSLLQNNILHNKIPEKQQMLQFIKSIIHQYYNTLTNNKMTLR